MKLLRSIIAVILMLSAPLSLFACGKTENDDKKPLDNTENDQSQETVLCQSCKEENPKDQKFCGNCGNALQADPSTDENDGSNAADGSNSNDGSDGSSSSDNEEKQYRYTVLAGDYFCLPATEIVSADPQTVTVITANLLRAVKSGTATLTVKNGEASALYTVTVLDVDTTFTESDYQTVSKEEVDKQIESERNYFINNYAEYEVVSDRTDVRMGDKVAIDYVGTMDGVAFEGGTGSYDLVIGSHSFIDGFEEGLVGATVGSTVELHLNFPDPYPNNEELSGKPVLFTVTVKSIQAPEEYTDQFIQRFTNNEYKTVADFEEYLRKTVVGDMLFENLLDNLASVAIPEELKTQHYDLYIEEMIDYLGSMGLSVSNKEDLISMMGYTEEQFDQMVWENVENTLGQDYVFYGYCKAKNLTLTEEVFNECAALYLARYDCKSLEELVKNYDVDYATLYETFLYEEILRSLYSEAVIT